MLTRHAFFCGFFALKGFAPEGLTGTAFETDQTIVPFRTNMTVTSSAKPRLIAIFESDTELAPDAPDSPAEELGAKSLKIYLSGNTLMIDSNYATDLKVFYPSGQYVRTLHVESGTNEYHDLHKGLYIIGTKKLMIP